MSPNDCLLSRSLPAPASALVQTPHPRTFLREQKQQILVPFHTKHNMQTRTTIIKKLAYLGAAICQGQLISGVQKAPQLIRDVHTFLHLQKNYDAEVVDYGDISLLEEEKTMYPQVDFAVRNLNVLGPLLGRLSAEVTEIAQKKTEDLLLTVGGDHSIATGTITGMRRVYPDLKVVWVDAHPDFINPQIRNPTKLYSENYHGMPLSHLAGATSIPDLPYWHWLTEMAPLDPKNIVLIGIRDIDKDEYISLKKHGVKCFTMDHIATLGIGEVMKQTVEYLDPEKKHPFHLSFDVDGIDPEALSQTGTLFREGLTPREANLIVRRLVHDRRLVSMDLVQINPGLNKDEPTRPVYRSEGELKEVTRTVGVGIDLISSLFTKYLEL